MTNILIVEDAEDLRYLLRYLLSKEGFQVNECSNGEEALKFLETAAALPNVILLDLMMPIMDGFQFREAQSKQEKYSKIPTIIMTADGRIVEKQDKTQAQGYLKKPFSNPKLILKAIDEVLRPSAAPPP